MKIHFMGIGGSGISAVARIAKAQGFEVSGCDLEDSAITRKLRTEGIEVIIGHNASHLKNIDILAHSPAVYYQSENHPEFTKAKNPMTWEKFMAKYLMKGKTLIAVSGTHGKGTTTAMMARVLEAAKCDPTVEVGANLLDWGKENFRSGKSKYYLCEADEFREKFLLYKPYVAIITSVEMDHPEYFKNFDAVLNAFVKFSKKSDILVLNSEDAGCNKLLKELKGLKTPRIIRYKSLRKSQAKLKFPGKHIRSDAGAVWAAARVLGVKDKVIKSGLENFNGLERRFEYRGETASGIKIYDDYAHHPTAVSVNINAIREKHPNKKIWAVFQPHMFSRLATLFDDFASSLQLADRIIISDVFTRREQGITKPSGKDLSRAVGPKATYIGGDLVNVANFLSRNAGKNDILLVMGAGDIYKVSDMILTSGSKSIS
ncbi:MAG: UDP-N-acetylmuramate--L-alanine ligase [Patescibacteria group bacterium]